MAICITNMVKLPDNPTSEQFQKIRPVLIKRILEEIYTSGIFDLTVNDKTEKNVIASGIFAGDDRSKRGKRPEFFYEILDSKNGPKVSYSPLSGVSEEEPDEENADYDEYSYSEYLEEIEAELAANLTEILENA